MPLFQKTILQKHLRALDVERLEKHWKVFTEHFHNPVIQKNIRNSNEEQYQEGFVEDLFVRVLGYVKNPAPDFNFITEQKNQGDSGKADGAILIDGNVRAVVELKGTNTNHQLRHINFT